MSRNDASMNKVSISENAMGNKSNMISNTISNTISDIILYTFRDKDAKHEDTITVIVQNNQALLIDTAYPEYAKRVREDLEQQNIKPAVVVLSHYHPDHVAGCQVFEDCEIYASEFYEPNYGNCSLWEPGFTYIRPKYLIQDGDTMPFGEFELEFIHGPGHSKCGLITCITDKIIQCNDLLMVTWDRKTTIPFVADGGSFTEHIGSLKQIKDLAPEIIIAPHGGMLKNDDQMTELIDNRIFYLKKMFESKGTLPLQAYLKPDISNYDHLELHDHNLMRLL